MKTNDSAQIEQRNEAAKVAIRVVRKFPQIEQAVLAPMLAREIGHALLQQQEKVALRCANIAEAYSCDLPANPQVGLSIAAHIRRDFGLEGK